MHESTKSNSVFKKTNYVLWRDLALAQALLEVNEINARLILFVVQQ